MDAKSQVSKNRGFYYYYFFFKNIHFQVPIVVTEVLAVNERKGPAAEQEDNDNYRWNLRFPKGSHCIKGRRSGV